MMSWNRYVKMFKIENYWCYWGSRTNAHGSRGKHFRIVLRPRRGLGGCWNLSVTCSLLITIISWQPRVSLWPQSHPWPNLNFQQQTFEWSKLGGDRLLDRSLSKAQLLPEVKLRPVGNTKSPRNGLSEHSKSFRGVNIHLVPFFGRETTKKDQKAVILRIFFPRP